MSISEFRNALQRDAVPSQLDADTESGEVSFLGTNARIASPPPFSAQDALIQRFYLQSLSRELLPDERVAKCLRQIIPGEKTVDVVYDPDKRKAHYKNLVTCARLWFCPVCASRITEQRAAELLQALTLWHQGDGFVALLTFTLRHDSSDNIVTLLNAIRDAHRRFKSGAPFQRLKERYDWQGSVTSLEVTYGENGWHPHLHELVFFGTVAASTWTKFPDAGKERWKLVLEAEGRDASWQHGLDVRDAETDVYNYVAKYGKLPSAARWTLEREIAKAATKISRRDGKTAWQLLIDYGDGDKFAGQLFQQYAAAFKGRNQLVWSRGLRDLIGLEKEQTDDDLAAALPDEYVVLVSLTANHWRLIMALPQDIRAELLIVASKGDKNELAGFLRFFRIYI